MAPAIGTSLSSSDRLEQVFPCGGAAVYFLRVSYQADEAGGYLIVATYSASDQNAPRSASVLHRN